MKKIKILFFIYQLGGGGAARTLLNIINNLDRSKYSPVMVTLDFNGSYEPELKNDVIFIKLPTKRLSRSVFKLAEIIRNEKVDIVFSTIPRVNTIAILATKFSFTKAKSVIREADNLGGSLRTNLQLLGFGMIYKFSSQIVSLSEGVKENLVKRYKVKPADIKVIYNPVDLQNIKRKLEYGQINPEHKKFFDTEDKVIITAGRLVKQKDQKTLIKAFSKVNSHLKSRLIILGEGPLKEELMKETIKLNVQDRVHFVGFQENPYVYFKHADLFVLSSIHEGFSHVIAEALATGVPVVSTNCKSGPAEVLDHGRYGQLCEVGNEEELANKMLHILSLDQKRLAEIIHHGQKRAQDFDAQSIVKQYEELFETVFNH
ncbi:glycosyltransferase [Calidifontibacillus erzurumensis]|jgi:glycosyltransferase involved in cell wall biosynthesis|uniref:glycosyltransferase n=1 Tax=Calidifontibacillus erzurumensis TaxID=2741433 RepID=UPI0035B56A44